MNFVSWDIEKDRSIQISKEDLACIAARVAPFASTNEFRQAMLNINFHNRDGLLYAVATDGHRLARYCLGASEGGGGLVPAGLIGMGHEYFDGAVEIGWNKDQVFINDESLMLVSRVCNDTYPDYERVIPSNWSAEMSVDLEHFIDKILRARAASDEDTEQIRLQLSDRGCSIESSDEDYGFSYSSKFEAAYRGEPMQIGFNGRFLSGVLGALDTPKAIAEFVSPTQVVKFGDDRFLFILMPVRLSV